MSTDQARAELAQLAATYRDATTTLDAARRRLHERVVTAIDVDGLTTGTVARALGVTRPRVNQIIVAVETARAAG
mgnify:CR=1 FL=1